MTSRVSYLGMQKAEVERGPRDLRSQEIPQTTHRGPRRSHSSRWKLLPSPPLSLFFLIQHRNPPFPVEEGHEENVSGIFNSAPWASLLSRELVLSSNISDCCEQTPRGTSHAKLQKP